MRSALAGLSRVFRQSSYLFLISSLSKALSQASHMPFCSSQTPKPIPRPLIPGMCPHHPLTKKAGNL